MAKKKKEEAGPLSKYRPEYNEQAKKLCMLGYTDKMLGDFFEVDERTINNWKKSFDKFFQSIREGKEQADMVIVNSLYKSAQDRQIEEKQAIKVREFTIENGKRVEREKVEYVTVTKAIPANDRSISFWLRNRQPKLWRDKIEVEDKTEKTDHVVKIDIHHVKDEDND